MWQEISSSHGSFGHPSKIPPADRQLQVKYLTRMGTRLKQRTSCRTFNGGHHWHSHFEMFTYDMNWNSTMTRAGWSPNNIHLLPDMVDLAVKELKDLRIQGHNYLDSCRENIEAWWRIQAMEMLERDPTLNGRDLTRMCQARYDRVHQTMMEYRARAMMNDPAIQFPDYFSAISSRPNNARMA